eukprot:TRINITY_DN3889_c1_g4_i4.p1 TRINITY_DN3889_c1_g4~~TRINITY_DN3889_c1_g4_i4.p1  ORF type:complete len:556 (-),score=147.70 TRINITY_DN3889_c1_g4_i4:49-1716(-)
MGGIRSCVCDLSYLENEGGEPNVIFRLTDGWYSILCVPDEPLQSLARQQKIFVGQKLMIGGAVLGGDAEPRTPLEMYDEDLDASTLRSILSLEGSESVESEGGPIKWMRVCFNGVRRARWDAHLGWQNCPTMRMSLRSIRTDGGSVSCVKCVVQRVFPLLYFERVECGEQKCETGEEKEKNKKKSIVRTQRGEFSAQADYEDSRAKAAEEIRDRWLAEHVAGGGVGDGGEVSGEHLVDDRSEHNMVMYMERELANDPRTQPRNISICQEILVTEYTPILFDDFVPEEEKISHSTFGCEMLPWTMEDQVRIRIWRPCVDEYGTTFEGVKEGAVLNFVGLSPSKGNPNAKSSVSSSCEGRRLVLNAGQRSLWFPSELSLDSTKTGFIRRSCKLFEDIRFLHQREMFDTIGVVVHTFLDPTNNRIRMFLAQHGTTCLIFLERDETRDEAIGLLSLKVGNFVGLENLEFDVFDEDHGVCLVCATKFTRVHDLKGGESRSPHQMTKYLSSLRSCAKSHIDSMTLKAQHILDGSMEEGAFATPDDDDALLGGGDDDEMWEP